MIKTIQTASIVIPSVRTKDATGEHTIDLARILTKNGIDTHVVCSFASDILPEDIQSRLRIQDNAEKIPATDLTILQYPHWSPLSECLRFAKGTTLFWYHGVTPTSLWTSPDGRELLQISERKTKVAWYADLAICASPFTAAELHRHAIFPMERIRVVPLGVDIARMERKPNVETLEELREKWKLQGKRVLLYVGRIASNKRIDLLVDALALLADSFPDLVLLIVGDSSSTAAYQEMAVQLKEQAHNRGIEERVIFTDKVEDVAPFYYLASLFVHASQHEGFCIPLIEAMAAGVPIIASESGAMPWVLNVAGEGNNSAGLTFPEGNSADLARQIQRLLQDSVLNHELRSRAKLYVRNFSKEKFAQRMHDVIAEATILSAHKLIEPTTKLHKASNIAMADYLIRSNIPVLGKIIERVRNGITNHVKEPYLDPILERQIDYNRSVVAEIDKLRFKLTLLGAEVEQLKTDQDEITTKSYNPK